MAAFASRDKASILTKNTRFLLYNEIRDDLFINFEIDAKDGKDEIEFKKDKN